MSMVFSHPVDYPMSCTCNLNYFKPVRTVLKNVSNKVLQDLHFIFKKLSITSPHQKTALKIKN